jgi:hypothetical protein
VKFAITAAIAVLTLAGCANRNIDSVDAVKQGVLRDISKNINVAAMDVNVVSVSFRDKEADAVVAFAPKGGTAAQGLTMSYTMERQGGQWHIKSRGAALQQHAAQAAPGMQQGGDMQGGDMPAGGAVGTGGQTQLPPGHPPLGDTKKQ